MFVSNLGSGQRTRFERLGDLSDLENAISNYEKAVELTDDRHPNKPMYLSNLGMASTLASSASATCPTSECHLK